MGSDAAKPPSRDGSTPERFGPLTIVRVAKDDGRALILYSHDEPVGESASETVAQTVDAPPSGARSAPADQPEPA